MNDYSFIDLFPEGEGGEENYGNDMGHYGEFNPANPSNYRSNYSRRNFSDDPSMNERMTINDYKHATHTMQKGSANDMNERQHYQPSRSASNDQRSNNSRKNKKGLDITEDKVVWAGALFIFFGVFVFLIGYWLGKSNETNISTTDDAYLSEMEESLSERQMDTTFVTGLGSGSDSGDNVLSSYSTLSTTPTTLPEEPVVAPPVVTTTTTSTTSTTTTTVAASATAGVVSAPDITGSFTLQVSAHTSMESARVVEEDLRALGYQSYVVESVINGTQYYRVRVGSFTSKNDANTKLAGLKATDLGSEAYLITLD